MRATMAPAGSETSASFRFSAAAPSGPSAFCIGDGSSNCAMLVIGTMKTNSPGVPAMPLLKACRPGDPPFCCAGMTSLVWRSTNFGPMPGLT